MANVTPVLTPVLPFDGEAPEEAASQQQQLAVVPTPHSVVALPGTVPPTLLAEQQVKTLKLIKAPSYDLRTDLGVTSNAGKSEPLTWGRWLQGFACLSMSGADNALAYLTFFTVRAFHGRLYTIVDLHLTLLPGVDVILLLFAILGSLTFVMMLVLVECMKRPLFHELMNFRLIFSALPCSILSGIILYYSERTEWAPFATVVAVLCTIFVWCLHMRVVYANSLNVCSKISLDISWFLAFICGATLCVLFIADELKIITNSNDLGCPYVANERMPVLMLPLGRWYCAPWDKEESMKISRAPINTVPVQVSCTQTFLSALGTSIEPHLIECPSGCLRTQASNVVGCGVYSVDSPLCLAAAHAGALTDQGGQAVVYGRLGVAQFRRCTRNSVTSNERYVTQTGSSVSVVQTPSSSSTFLASGGRRLTTVPQVIGPGGLQIPQAFHFNTELPGGLPQTREYIWLKEYEEVPSNDAGIKDDKPWTRIQGTVSLRIAGIELSDEKVRLGQTPTQPLFVQVHPGQVFDAKPAECYIGDSGVICEGAGSAVVQLDFCRKEVKQCLDP